MRNKRFRAALLSILIVTSLIVPAVLTMSLLSVSPASASPDPDEIYILRGKDTAYNIDLQGPLPWVIYEKGDRPPLMVAKEVGDGKAVAAGFIPGCRNGDWNNPQNPDPHLPELLDATFQWLVPDATEVLWYEGYNVYNSVSVCSELAAELEALGYTITPDSTTPITSSLLAPYDILIIPQLQIGGGTIGGEPSLLPDADVNAIKTFVEGGKGAIIWEATDFHPYQFHNVHNKILMALGFENLFQPDSVYDDTNNIADANYRAIVDVDPATAIGSAYQSATGKTTIGLYGYCSLAEAWPSVSIKVMSDYQVGMPGATLEYRIIAFNPENPLAEDLTYNLTVEDNSGWGLDVYPTSLSVPVGENGEAILIVTIPSGTPLCTEDKIVVTAVASGHPEVEDSFTCIAHAGKRIRAFMDAYVSIAEGDKTYGSDDPLPLYTGRYGEDWQYTYLQFDLWEIPSGVSITDARLFLFCYNVYGTQVPIACTEVDDDAWDELTITWNNKPDDGPILDQQLVRVGIRDFPISYSWDVTSFVDQEFKGDKVVSLCLRGLEDHPPSVNESFESKDWPYEDRVHPFLRVSYPTEVVENKVSVSIELDDKSGQPGDDVTFEATIKNEGTLDDSYSLTVTDTAGWSPSISPSTLTLDAGDSGTATLTVTIPSGAADGATDSITVTATSPNSGVSASKTCTAKAGEVVEKVKVTIDKTSKDGKPGDDVTYTVTVTNEGTSTDTFSLQATDTAGWSPSISPSTLTLDAGASDTATVTVTIPSDAAEGASTTITVTASGTGYDDSITSTARVKEEGLPMTLIAIVVVVVVIVVVVALMLLRGRRAAPSW